MIKGQERIEPKNGDIIVFPPLTPHAVEENTGNTVRRSFALTVNEGDDRQVKKDVLR